VTAAISEPPGAFRRRLLLERAAMELGTGSASVIEIGLGAGYSSPDAFARAFARGFGRSPTAFRTAPLHACEPPRAFTFAGVLAHVLTFAAVRRTLAIGALESAGVTDLGSGDPMAFVGGIGEDASRITRSFES